MVLVLVVPEWDSSARHGPRFVQDSAVANFLASPEQPNSSTAVEKRHQITAGLLLKRLRTGTAAGRVSNRAITPEHIGATQVVALCAAMQQSVCGELDTLERFLAQQTSPGDSRTGATYKPGDSKPIGGISGSFPAAAGSNVRSSSPVPGSSVAPTSTPTFAAPVKPKDATVRVVFHNSTTHTVEVMIACAAYSQMRYLTRSS